MIQRTRRKRMNKEEIEKIIKEYLKENLRLENGEEYFETYISQMSILDMFRGLDRSIWTYQNGFVKAIKYLLLGDWVKCREAIFILKMSFYE